MSIIENVGDLLQQRGILVHGANAYGDSDQGMALAMWSRFPQARRAYEARAEGLGLQLGDIVAAANPRALQRDPRLMRYVGRTCESIPEDVIVATAITQYNYDCAPPRVLVDYFALESAFQRVYTLAKLTGLPVHIPRIGCGGARGDWGRVRALIERSMHDVDAQLWIPQ